MRVTQWHQAGYKGGFMSTQTISGGVSVTVQSGSVSNPLLPNNKAGVYFDIIQEHSLSLQNQITDNYIENNTAIQDHIAHSPLVISLRGLSGEVVYKPPQFALNEAYKNVNSFIQDRAADRRVSNNMLLTDKLTVIPALLPPVDNVTQMAKNAVQYVEASVNRYIKIVEGFTSTDYRQTRLEQIYNDLATLRDNNALLIVETPYEAFDNMAIQSITLRQGVQNYITDIELTLKQINYATTYRTEADTSVMAIYNACARAEEANHGKAQGVDVNRDSILSKWMLPSDVPVSNYKKK